MHRVGAAYRAVKRPMAVDRVRRRLYADRAYGLSAFPAGVATYPGRTNTPPKRITYRGVSVIEGWPEQIQKAQSITTCRPDGVEMPRVRYGDEDEDWGATRHPCHDCAVIKGEFHVPGCDVERCPKCGGQFGGCDCDWPEFEEDEEE